MLPGMSTTATKGWTCTCGQWVAYGQFHSCGAWGHQTPSQGAPCSGAGRPAYLDYGGPGGAVVARCPACRRVAPVDGMYTVLAHWGGL